MSFNGAMNTRPGAGLLKPLSFKMFTAMFAIAIITKFIQLTGKQSDSIDTVGMISYYVTALLGAMTIYYRVAPSTMTTSLTVIAMFGVLFFFQDLVDILVRKPKEKELKKELAVAESTPLPSTTA
jgi:branched-subunit amino acid ABC-type transport system permease component